MTEQEAIKRINECRNTPNFQPYHYVNEALDMGIKALEKQIAKKPINETKGEKVWTIMLCPCCNRSLWTNQQTYYSEPKYCYSCGQKLDWGNEDAE